VYKHPTTVQTVLVEKAPRIIDLGARSRFVVSFTLRSLYTQKKNPTENEAGWASEMIGHCGKKHAGK
jgi:hypothetical protein